jgi:Mg-chelatase subunit ChlD
MQTRESKRDKWISVSLIVGAVLAGLAALAVQRRGAVAVAGPPAPAAPPVAPQVENPPPAPPAQVAKTPRPRVDIVFALDTTGSMSGLIEGAKRKIWGIASFVARAQPTPDLRVGLVAYRDVGDEYVTRTYDLDDNLDRVYRRLLAFRADGGGDAPEHVARALTEAVHKMSWSRAEDGAKANDKAVRLIYLVGDAPPHTDYHDGYDCAKAARDAAAMGIQVHAVRCGADTETATYWRRIAALGHGEFLTIDQDGGMLAVNTPYDDDLARLHDELSGTVVPYGEHAAEMGEIVRLAATAAPAVKADRAGYVAAKRDKALDDDLVGRVASGALDVKTLNRAALPETLRRMSEPVLEEKVKEDARRREEIVGRIAKLSGDREAYLRSHAARGKAGFDVEVEKTVTKAGAAVGLSF